MTTDPAFSGFGKDALPFLKALGFHQNREWFLENKKLYDTNLREPLVTLVDAASDRLQSAGIPLLGTRKSSLFRINRDIRFTKEKHPYNTHVSAVLTRNGTKKDTGGIYMHFSPGDCFLASGLWFPPSPQLKAMREQIVARQKEFYALVEHLEAKKLPIGPENMVSRTPAGFRDVSDETLLFWLRHKSYTVSRKLPEKLISSPKLIDEIVTFGQDIMPLMQFIWRAVDPLLSDNKN